MQVDGTMVIVISVTVLIRILVGLWGHSGMGCPPMFGDFEAQRHWLEITTALPIGEWYKQTDQNDLMYWGLDYPPLTAYVSWIFGKIAHIIIPDLVALNDSRGVESIEGKTFMRLSVIVCDLLLLIPIAFSLCKAVLSELKLKKSTNESYPLYLLSCLLLPGLILIDHGHFQYNGVCLALSLYGILLLSQDYDILGSIFYCLSLNFKQMSLYYAPVFFCYLLRKCLMQKTILHKALKFIQLGLTVVLTFSILWLPYCIYSHTEETCASSLLLVLQRQFPFSRGIFEDKVANIWYTVSVIVDIRTILNSTQLLLCSLSLTILLLAPTCVYLLLYNVNIVGLLFATIASSLAFFLASFQVHEKSILLALTPAAFLVLLNCSYYSWIQLMGCFTMFPLLIRDKLRIPYAVCGLIYLTLVSLLPSAELKHRQSGAYNRHTKGLFESIFELFQYNSKRTLAEYLLLCQMVFSQDIVRSSFLLLSSFGMALLHISEILLPPPARLPDLYAALFSLFGAVNLCIVYTTTILGLWTLPVPVDTCRVSAVNGGKHKSL